MHAGQTKRSEQCDGGHPIQLPRAVRAADAPPCCHINPVTLQRVNRFGRAAAMRSSMGKVKIAGHLSSSQQIPAKLELIVAGTSIA